MLAALAAGRKNCKFLLVVLLTIFLSLAVSGTATAESDSQMIEITADTAVFAEPQSEAAELKQVEQGDLFVMLEEDLGWYKIDLGSGSSGWVSAQNATIFTTGLAEEDLPPATVQTAAVDYTKYKKGNVNTSAGLRLRSGPGTGYSSLRTLSNNTVLYIFDSQGSWFNVYVASSKQIGWVSSQYVKLTNTKVSAVNIKESGSQPSTTLKGKLIYLDPGHGSYNSSTSALDRGASGFGLYESDVNYAISLKVYNNLVALGATVKMTRTDVPVVMSLADRAAKANNAGADLFVSIHCNSFTSSAANGTSTWFYAPAGNNKYNRNNRELLSETIQASLVKHTGLKNYGVREQNLAVLRETNMTSCLVETAFLSNAQDNAYLASESGKTALAKGISEGINNYFKNGGK
ncbi:MAG: N-acetylmuramoyl-L-alanine amidase [Bacillota bacterium]|jgi:N-acetylmuramoyl-L-alanine amidase